MAELPVESMVEAGGAEKPPAPVAAVEKLDGVQEAVQAAAVSQEEIERLTVREGISDAERAQLYLSGGQAVQQLAVIENLPGLLRAAGRSAFPAIARSLAEAARQLDAEGQLTAAESFATVARERLLPGIDLADVLLPLVLAGVANCTQPASQAAWITCLGDMAAVLDATTLHNRVLPALLQRGAGSGQTLRDRCLSCQLLGALAPHAGSEDLQRCLLKMGASLCQDTEWQVRHAACQQLPVLAAAAADKLVESCLEGVLEDLFGMLDDEEALVRAAAWRALAACLDLLPMRLRRSRALPLLLRRCRDPEHHAEVHRSLTAGMGLLMTRLVADMEGDAEVSACLGYFRSQAWRHDHATRLNCAAAFPLVLKAGTARRYGSHLHDTFLRLASDGDAEVRLAIAGALPDVASLLGRDRCCQYLRQPVAALLQDERQEVQARLLQRLPEVLEHFCLGSPEDSRTKTLTAFIDPLLRLEAVSGYSWRLQLSLLHAIAAFPAFFAPDQLHDRFLPLAWKYMADGVAAVREAAAAAVAAIWRALRKPSHRVGVYSRAIHEFAQSKRFRLRMVFLDFCRATQRHFSSKFVKAHLLAAALTLAYDPVANVRLHLAAAMPALKQVLTLPDDVQLLERLNSGMSHLITDGDPDVRREARKANEDFKGQPVRMSCGALESSPQGVKDYEAADAARVEAERDFLLDADQLEKIHADIAAYDELLRPAHTRLVVPLQAAPVDAAPGASSRVGRSGRIGALAKQNSGALAGPAGAALPSHLRSSSSSDVSEQKRGRGLMASLQAGRSASADGQQPRGRASSSSSGSGSNKSRSGSAGGRAPARLKHTIVGTPPVMRPGSEASALPSAAAGTPAPAAQRKQADSAAPATGAPAAAGAAAGDQPHQQIATAAAQPTGSGPSRLGRQSPGLQPSPGLSPKPPVPRLNKPSPSAATKRPAPGAPLLAPPAALPAVPPASQPAPAAATASSPGLAAADSGGPAGASQCSDAGAQGSGSGRGSGRGILRRPSLRGVADRAVQEVQQLALKLRSALMSVEPTAAAARARSQQASGIPRPGGTPAGKAAARGGAGSSGGGGIRVAAEGRGAASGSDAVAAAPAGGSSLTVGVRAMSKAARGPASSDAGGGS